MTGAALTERAVNRATLARQHLLERAGSSAFDEIAHLGGMQAQAPLAPYVGLWTRLRGFEPDELSALYLQRRVVRMALMRGTIHLATAADALAWRPLVETVIVRITNSAFGRQYGGLDFDALAAAARELTEQSPRTYAELGTLLAERFPGRDPNALAQAARAHLPLVQIPPRGLWGATGRIAHTTARAWLGRDADEDQTPDKPEDPGTDQTPAAAGIDAMVQRYLSAFGPATVMDAQAWSGLTRLREVFDRLRPTLHVTRARESGAELFDLPDAPRPDPDAPAPARFLPEYDNVLFAHADRTRINPAGHTIPLFPGNGATLGYYLLDGVWSGLWRVDRDSTRSRSRDSGTARLTVQHFGALPAAARDELTGEGLKLLAFLAPDAASPEIRIAPAP